ncbi:family 1 glycosyltransferase [Melampsora larici-populina 98AG31]|uniref:sterol 3beta-glucosyltransferase n=1 Tax=Melampsora larici-populina (strain 98AG31 / pathotype 3-4-7) TaxID=747676 RepID=F4SCI6_MELLP|nr:family 1 glycosyltransferase [Melampsora larici-populina 98AG31]EGF97640.1 family 1 glycosyltransferase [Melampsora larici-populina 98AG31]
MFQSTTSDFLNFKPNRTLHITCLTIGSRGDVQPYIALCNELAKDGHRTRIASHGEYKDWIEGYGIEFVEIGGDPAELMKICVDNGMFTLSFLKEGLTKFRGWLDDLLSSAYEACQGTDLLIESPSTMAGIHVAEALGIPYFRAFTMPWTRTRTYPHAFAVPDHRMGGGYNYMTYTVFDQVFWRAISGQVNRWRKEKLGLRSTTFDKMECHKVPFLYNFSPSIVPMPIDWFEWVHITGYWFLDEGQGEDDKKIDQELIKFLNRSREMGKKIVYIGFGSIVVPDPIGLSKMVIEAVEKSGVHAVVSKGWSDRMSKKDNQPQKENQTKEDDELINESEQIFNLQSVPHDWLFPKIDAVCHHGGAGTTGASLRAGVPTIIRPFFGDQYFWADRVEKLGIGLGLKKMNVKSLCKALEIGTKDEVMIKKAKMIGELIRSESGVSKAVESIYRDLEYAKSLIKKNKTKELGGEEEDQENQEEEEENQMESSDQCEIEESGSGETEESQLEELDGCEGLEGDDEEDLEEGEGAEGEGEEEDNSSWDHLSQPSMSPFFGPLS